MDLKELRTILYLFTLNLCLKAAFIKKYPVGADSFHFLNNANTHELSGKLLYDLGNIMSPSTLTITIFILGTMIVPIFYLFIRDYLDKPYSILATIGLIISPIFFYQTQYNWVDKNGISLIFIILGYMITFKEGINENIRIVMLGILSMIFSYCWEGYILLPIICYSILLLRYIKEKLYIQKYILIGLMILVFIVKLSSIFHLIYYFTLIPDKYFISELVSPLLMSPQIEYILLFGAIFAVFQPNLVKRYRYLYLCYLIALIGFIIGFRLVIYLLPMAYLWFGLTLSQFKPKNALFFTFVVVIGILSFSFGTYNDQQYMNDNMLEVFQNINKDNRTCLVSIWDKGYIFEYYTNKFVYYKGSGAYYQENYKHYINNIKTDCITVFNQEDLNKLLTLAKYDNESITFEDFRIFQNQITYLGGDYYGY